MRSVALISCFASKKKRFYWRNWPAQPIYWMNQGEIVFYLREITSHWAGSNVSPQKLAELEAASLIEVNRAESTVVRLTPEGQRCKESFRRQHSAPNGITLTDAPPRRHSPHYTQTVARSKRRAQEFRLR